MPCWSATIFTRSTMGATSSIVRPDTSWPCDAADDGAEAVERLRLRRRVAPAAMILVRRSPAIAACVPLRGARSPHRLLVHVVLLACLEAAISEPPTSAGRDWNRMLGSEYCAIRRTRKARETAERAEQGYCWRSPCRWRPPPSRRPDWHRSGRGCPPMPRRASHPAPPSCGLFGERRYPVQPAIVILVGEIGGAVLKRHQGAAGKPPAIGVERAVDAAQAFVPRVLVARIVVAEAGERVGLAGCAVLAERVFEHIILGEAAVVPRLDRAAPVRRLLQRDIRRLVQAVDLIVDGAIDGISSAAGCRRCRRCCRECRRDRSPWLRFPVGA